MPSRPTAVRLAALSVFASLLVALGVLAAPSLAAGSPAESPFPLEEVLGFPYALAPVAAAEADRIAWVVEERGTRSLWTAAGPEFEAARLVACEEDDGRPLGGLALTPDGTVLVYVRGGGPNRAGEHPNPDSDPDGAEQAIWAVPADGSAEPRKLAEGSGPVISPDGAQVAFARQGTVFEVDLAAALGAPEEGSPGEEGAEGAPAEGDEAGSEEPDATEGAPRELFTARGGLGGLAWSPDGDRIAFTSDRDDHAFVGVYDREADAIRWVAPSVDRDTLPTWSPDGERLAFVRLPGRRAGELFDLTGGSPFAVWVGDPATGEARELWASPDDSGGFAQYYPPEPLRWVSAGGGAGRILFTSEHTGWLHVHSLDPSAEPGAAEPVDLTPGDCEAEHTTVSPDGATLVFSSNCGDRHRRHLWRVPVAGGESVPVTTGDGLETDPAALGGGGSFLAFRRASARRPQAVVVTRLDGTEPRILGPELPPSFPVDALVEPQEVSFQASDGLEIHGQLFLPPGTPSDEGAGEGGRRPAAIFLHGGPIRQMLVGFHYSHYYARAYAMNQYLASRGWVALAVNFRSGIGYGRDFRRADGQGPRGATEYRDVLAAGLYLRRRGDVDPERITLWGGSYGGYLTAMGLARDSDLFAAGVDLHGVHDWALRATDFLPGGAWGLTEELLEEAKKASPVHDLTTWSSPVLMIHGDDDRNVLFLQTTDLVQRLRERDVPVEVLIFPDEVHGFLRHESWLRAYRATADFLERHAGE
ncbi:MAG: S9 family peptidase [Thermoanaerobaculia bacterium]